MDKEKLRSPIDRRNFLRTCGSLLAGGVALVSGGLLAAKASGKNGDVFWQIDPYKCTQSSASMRIRYVATVTYVVDIIVPM